MDREGAEMHMWSLSGRAMNADMLDKGYVLQSQLSSDLKM